MIHSLEVCVFVCPHSSLKTIANTRFLLYSYVDWREISDKFACQDQRSRSFFGGFKVTRYELFCRGYSEIPSPSIHHLFKQSGFIF